MKYRIIKNTVMLIVCVSMLLTFPASVLADNSSVTYDGDANKYVFLPGTDLFSSFKGVMPGDTLTQNITVKNATSNGVKVKIYLRAEPVEEQYRSFLNQMTLKVVQESGSVLFSASAGAQDGLASNVYLGMFYSGADIELKVTLTVPIGMGNEFQNGVGKIHWVFTAEEYPTGPDDPQTGDTADLALYIILSAVSAVGIAALILFRRRSASKSGNLANRER